MRPGPAIGWGTALLCGAALLAGGVCAYAAPAEPAPAGFVWEDLQEIHVFIPRPEKWFFRRIIPAAPLFDFSPQPFADQFGSLKGVVIHRMAKTDQPADELAAGWVAKCAEGGKVVRGWTKKASPAEPFTTYGLIYLLQSEDTDWVACTCEIVVIANRVTNTVYQCWIVAPTTEWKDVEQTGETMFAHLQLDSKS